MRPLLRQYDPHECGEDGYPFAWHRPSTGAFWTMPSPIAFEFPIGVAPPIKDLVRAVAGHRCLRCGHPYRKGEHPLEDGQSWSPCDELCAHGGRLGIDLRFVDDAWQARARILTVHHLDEEKANCRWWNLAALCQRCHLRMQRTVVMDRPYHFEHSAWFRPFAAGFYAFKYLGHDLDREQTLARLDELLKLEWRFVQEAL